MAAMATVPSYTPSLWVRMCHALPRLDLTMTMRDNLFIPDSWEYQQTLLVLSSLSAIALVLSLLVIISFLIHYCCCRRGDRSEGSEEEEEDEEGSTGHGYGGKKGRGICCVTWVSVAAVTLCCVAIGVGFYGNSEANDGIYQLTSSLLTANYTLASIDLLVSDTISGLQLSIAGPLTTMEELFTGSKPYLVSTRNCRRLSENVVSLLTSLTMARSSDGGAWNSSNNSGDPPIAALTPVPPSMAPTVAPVGGVMPRPFSPGWAANTLMVNEDYRWLSYVLLLLLDLLVCLFILLGLAKQARWLLILMTVLAWLALFLSWGSLGLETATVVAVSDFCTDPNTFVLNSTHFNSGTSSDVLDYYLTCSRRMNSPFQQLLTQSQRALSSIHTHLSSLDRNALPQVPKAEKSLREVQQILNATEGNFHQLVALLNCRGLNKDYIDSLKGLCYDGMEGLLYLSLYSFLSALAFTAILCSLPGAWRSFPSDSEEYEDSDSESEDPFTSHQYSPSMLTGYGGSQTHPNSTHSRNLYSR
ncbi:protein tweety homolog 1-like isoform X2 [Salvelinus fontinalis]|uniref:protein tweety homolog 1-like isoform X2 n=1 Tax=Salvelinus fontinalis TaxID=8038 RepID=UPI0024855A43|nr:protein tweety homolog 1-like isoform X2 [Salvelinus fontinalis]